MLSTDRIEFEAQLETLCAGFNVPFTQARKDAYWAGLSKMSLLAFVRCVETALGEEGPTKIPTTGDIWKLHQSSRTRATVTQAARTEDQRDHLEFLANRLLLEHLASRGGFGSMSTFKPGYGLTACEGSEELAACLKFKRELVQEFSVFIREGDPDASALTFVTQFSAGLNRISRVEESTLRAWEHFVTSVDAQKPFDASTARALESEQSMAFA